MNHFLAFLLLSPALTAGPEPHVVGLAAGVSGRDVVITITLTGETKTPAPVLLENPFRIYLDVPGARPGSQRLLEVNAGPVARVRAALNRSSPPVTRIVIELTAKAAWTIDRSAGGRELRVVISGGGETAPSASATPSSGKGAVIFQPAAAAPAGPPARDRRERIKETLFSMAGALEEMRAWKGPQDSVLATMIGSLEQLSADARGLQITGTAPDAALVAAVDAVFAAATARAQALADGSAQSRSNAIAAASGALLLLEHARKDSSK